MNWQNNRLQFTRLLAEVSMAGGLTSEQKEMVCDSMDVDSSELEELFVRAEQDFEQIKIDSLSERKIKSDEDWVSHDLFDQYTGPADNEQIKAITCFGNGQIWVMPQGYGDYCSADGSGAPVLIEKAEGELRVVVWSDINDADPTHTISLERAVEKMRAAPH